MRRVTAVLFALLLIAASSSTLSAQQSIYMLADTIRGDQPAPHNREFKLNSIASAASNTTTMGGSTGGLTAGKAAFSPVKVSMRFHAASSASFHRSVALGTRLPSIEIRLYNSADRMFYKTVYENVILTSIAVEGSDEAVEQIEFVFSRVRWFASPDAAAVNAPVQIGCFDLALVKVC